MEFQRHIAIIVAIDAYQNGLPALRTPIDDARAVSTILQQQHGYESSLVLNQAASKANLLEILEQELPRQVTEKDCLLFYFAGHGIALNGEDGPEGYLIPQDGKLGDIRSFIPMSAVYDALHQLDCSHFLGILDCCFAGSFRWSSTRDIAFTAPGVLHKERFDRFIQDPAWQVITSAAHDQTALDAFSLRTQSGIRPGTHSPFAEALIEALSGKADAYPAASDGLPAGDGVITATELYLYLRDRVEITTKAHAVRQTPGLHSLKKHDKGEYIFLTPGHTLNLPQAPVLDASKNPYRGLQPFEEEHSAFFFGRDKITQDLRDFVESHPLTVVLGASGSGKSSLVKAGLIPQLKRDSSAEPRQWHILPSFRPGEEPFRSFSAALEQASLPSVASRSSQGTLARIVTQWAKKHPHDRLLIFIDQSEELVTLCTCEEERQLFFQQILNAIGTHADKLRVVLTLRADFEPQVRDAGLKFMPEELNRMGKAALKDRWQQGRFIVPAMTRAELRHAIEQPAEARVMHFETHDLVEQLIDEVADMPGALPLLSFGLSELYLSYLRRQQAAKTAGVIIDRALTEADYNELGGIVQSLTQRANQEYEKLLGQDLAYATTVRNVMLRMVVAGSELIRRRVPEAELVYPEPENSRVRQVIRQFLLARLLVINKDTNEQIYYEPAHDALVKGWDKLLAWQKDNEEKVILQRRLTHSVTEWKHYLNQVSEAPTKTDCLLSWLDTSLYAAESSISRFISRISKTWYSRLRPTDAAQKPAHFLWNTNPYLKVLGSTLEKDSSWFNHAETTFVQQSLQKKRQNASWRLRLASTIALIITAAAVTASIQWFSAQRRLVSTIDALTVASQELFDSNQEFEALLTGLKAAKQADRAVFGISPDTKYQVKKQLQQAIHDIKERNRLEAHRAQVYSVDFDPSSYRMASAGVDGIIMIWDAHTGRLIRSIQAHDSAVDFVAFSPTGRLLASVSAMDQSVKLWNIHDGRMVASFSEYQADTNGTNGVSFSPDEKTIAAASQENTIKLWNIDTQREIGTLSGHKEQVNGVSFSPDGSYLVSASTDKTIRLWQMSTQQTVAVLEDHRQGVYAVRFSPNGRLIASSSEDDTIKFWDAKTRQLVSTIESAHAERPTTLSFSPNGQRLVSAGFDGLVKVWNVETREKVLTLDGHQGHVTGVSFHPDGRLMASASADSTIKLWDLGDDDAINLLSEQLGKVQATQFSPSGALLAWATDGEGDNTIKLRDMLNPEDITSLKGHTSGIQSLDFSPSEQLLASASWDGTVRLWDIATSDTLAVLEADNNWVNDIKFSPSGKLLASGGKDATIKLWDVAEQENIRTLKGHSAPVRGLSFDPSGRLLASASWDKTIKLWDVETGENIATLVGHIAGVADVSFSPDGTLLASSSDDTTVKLWDVNSYQAITTLRGHRNWVSAAKFSPSGDFLASASRDHTIKLWSLANYKEVNVLRNHRAAVNSVHFSPDSDLLVSGSDSGQVILWDIEALTTSSLQSLFSQGCRWMRGYLENNPNVSDRDRQLCDDT